MPEMSRCIYALKQILIRTMRLAFLYPRNALHFVVSFDYGIVSRGTFQKSVASGGLIISYSFRGPRIFFAEQGQFGQKFSLMPRYNLPLLLTTKPIHFVSARCEIYDL